MKLVPFLVAATLALTGIAHADDRGPADPYGEPAPRERPMGAQGPGRGALRSALLAQFDRNGDGRLEPNERRHALRVLRRIERRLARDQGGQEMRGRRLQKLIRKYDLNGDGNVGPGEMPPAMAKRLRRLDRDGNGWIDQHDFDRRQ